MRQGYLFYCEQHRQGLILSPAQFVLYLDELLVELRSLGVGCKVEDMFMGAAGFCDDLFLLASTRDGMQVVRGLETDSI